MRIIDVILICSKWIYICIVIAISEFYSFYLEIIYYH